MQEEKTSREEPTPPEQTEQAAPEKPPILTIRIDKTTYKVAIHFSRTSKETMGEKIARLIETEPESTSAIADTAAKPPPENPVPQNGLTAGKENK